MFSPNALPDVIEKIDSWSQEELAQNINDVLPVLTTSIKEIKQKALSLRSVHILLERCVPCVPVSQLNSNILQHALPVACGIFQEALEGITIVLQDTENLSDEEMEITLKSLHHVCFGLTEQLKSVLLSISSHCPISASKIASMPCTVLQILWLSFTHCHNSEELYGTTREYLLAFFANSKLLLSSLTSLLLSGLQFNLSSEEDEMLFRNVLDSLVNVAKSTTFLGVSVQNIAWSTYVNLVERYKSYKDFWNTSDISSPVEMMATSIANILSEMIDIPWTDFTLATKALTVLSFLVRVLTKLCSVFAGYLTDTCMPSLQRLLELQLRCCCIDLDASKEKSKLLKEVEKRVGVAAASMISSLVTDRSFVQTYFATHQKTMTDGHLGKLLTAVNICRTLVNSDCDTRKLWTNNPDAHILTTVFTFVGFCHPELCSDMKFKAACALGKSPRMVDLYEHVLTSAGALALLLPSENFYMVENILVNNISQLNPWRSLLAMDLWCLLARQSPIIVKVHHATFLLELLKNQQCVQCNPIEINLRILFRRLWPLLPSRQQMLLIEKYPPQVMPEVWDGVNIQALFSDKDVVHQYLSDARAVLEAFPVKASLQTYKELIKNIKLILLFSPIENDSISSKTEISIFPSSLLALWSLICKSLLEFANEGWLSHFIYTLCDLTQNLFIWFDNSQVLQVLGKCAIVVTMDSTSCLKLKILSLLQALAERIFDCNSYQEMVFQEIVNIFVDSLQDESCIVQQEALLTFEYFAHVTQHEQIIKYCLKKNVNIQERVALYLKKVPVSVEKSKDTAFASYLKLQKELEFTHQCTKKKRKQSRITCLSPNKSFNSSSPVNKRKIENTNICDPELTNAIKRLQTDALFISKMCKLSNLSVSTRTKLSKEVATIEESVKEISNLLKHNS